MRKTILSLITLVIVCGCAAVKTNEIIEMKKENIKPVTMMYWEKRVKEFKEKERSIKEEQKKQEVERRSERPKPVAVAFNNDNAQIYELYEITAYTAYEESTGKTESHPEFGVTASGAIVKENHTIACPRNLSFGTEIYIPHFNNTFVCEDRGGAIKGRKLDVYMKTVEEALEFGRQKLEIKIIRKPDES